MQQIHLPPSSLTFAFIWQSRAQPPEPRENARLVQEEKEHGPWGILLLSPFLGCAGYTSPVWVPSWRTLGITTQPGSAGDQVLREHFTAGKTPARLCKRYFRPREGRWRSLTSRDDAGASSSLPRPISTPRWNNFPSSFTPTAPPPPPFAS